MNSSFFALQRTWFSSCFWGFCVFILADAPPNGATRFVVAIVGGEPNCPALKRVLVEGCFPERFPIQDIGTQKALKRSSPL